ncbi:HNH endonuclease signature motif containing protein [Pseudonocardia sp. MH-G8]|uniref:HNH endonuclease signature motif containing protein n=1 Tax=Pseudonocardia sp. MH-G8 TaxID=1854588 RepID=UPI000B9FCE60|nr:HNH endonuclease signature motif containing protein [Pseudonocardia sp. MH-G8]OZM76224.1 hypothetical protein CFP66_42320 [Pseudonocardia sp. MH-G8]
MAEVVDLVDQAVALPPGPELSAVLGGLPWEKIPNARLVEVVQARSRQLAHDQAELFAGLVEITHAVAVADLPGKPRGTETSGGAGGQADDPVGGWAGAEAGERPAAEAETVARAGKRFEWAAHEIAAGLTWTPTAADRELTFATALIERLPTVFTALQQGRIDRSKARVFVDHLDPANGDVTEQQSRLLRERFLPQAPGLTTKQLSDRLYRAMHAIDPEFRRRRYQRAIRERSVALYLDSKGTATLVGDGLPPDEAAAAAGRIDRLVEAAKRAGHLGRRPQISADLYLGMLNGAFHRLTEAQIIAALLAAPRPEDNPPPDATADDTAADDADDAEPADETTLAEDTADGPEADIETGDAPDPTTGENTEQPTPDHAAGDRMATREGIEIRLGLATLAGLDDRPGEIPGLGPIGATLARNAVAAQRRGASWKFAIVDTRGHLLLAGTIRRRPRNHPDQNPRPDPGSGARAGRVRGGVVELHISVEELERYAADPALADWHPLLAEIAARWADRDNLRARLAAHPRARFARGPLADHVRARDRSCCGPGCTRTASSSDLDHTNDHGRGGKTVEGNIGPACKRHHPDKDRGWSLTQPSPGLFRWLSPLGRVYWTRGEPIRLDLPDPDPDPDRHPEDQDRDDADHDQRLRRYDPRILDRPATDPPRPPPPIPNPLPPQNDEPPF